MKRSVIFRTVLGLWIGLVTVFFLASPAGAISPEEEAQRESKRIEQEQQRQLERDRERLQQKAGEDGTKLDIETPEEKKLPPGGQKFTFHTIELQGADLLSDKTKRKLTEKYLNRPIDFSEINDLLNDILAHYFLKGYVSARVYIIPEQNISSGVLRLKVLEGVIEDISLADEDSRINLFTAFPMMEGKVLNLRDVEQGIDQINRLPSNNADIKLLPGTKDGYSKIVVSNEKQFPLSGSISYNNTGSDSTGNNQLGLSLSVDNPLRINDALGVSINVTTPGHGESYRETVPGTDDQYSHSALFNYSVPLGYTTFSLGASRSQYSIPIVLGDGSKAYSEGKSVSQYLTIDRMLLRTQTDKLNLSGTLTIKDSDNYFMGDRIEVSSRKLVVLDISSTYSTVVYGGFASFKLTYSKGTRLLDADRDPSGHDASQPTTEFGAVKCNLSYYRPIDLLGIKSTYSGTLSAQYSDDVLYGTEQISIGGLYSVRGFQNVSESGDRGWYLQNTLTFTTDIVKSHLGISDCAVSPFIGLDIGQILFHYSESDRWLAGAACGLSMNYKKFNVNLTYAHPLFSSNQTFADRDNKHGRVLVLASMGF